MTKDKSNRQLRREKMRSQEMRSRLITIGVVSVVAIAIAFVLIYPNFRPAQEVIMPEVIERPQVDGTALGDPNAPAKIEVFEDFQCPACKQFTESIEPLIVKQLVETGQAYYVFRHYPFLDTGSPGKESRNAANASMCANNQGKFWEYHDVLFANWNGENRGAFNSTRLLDFGRELDLNMADFEACVDDSTHADEIQASFDEGNSRGVTGTPSVFVNGQIVNPGFIPSFDEIVAAVQAAQP